MFLQVSVMLFTGGVLGPGRVPGGDPPRTATAASGTHPTGMHSCYVIVLTSTERVNSLADVVSFAPRLLSLLGS